MADKIEESIIVAAVFNKSPLIKPVWFIWRGRQYRILKVTYTWTDKEGQAKRYHFSVSDEAANIYELCYNSERLTWRLVALDAEG